MRGETSVLCNKRNYNKSELKRGEPVNITKRQHTVPRAYLKNFSDKRKNGQYLFTYDKKNGKIHEDNIKNAAVEKDWYTLELSENKLAWEDFYATEIEPRYEKVDRLIKTSTSALIMNRSEVIDDNTRIEIAILMIYQLFRGRTGRKYTKVFAEKVIPEIIDEAREEIGDRIREDEFADAIEKISSDDFQMMVYAEVLTDPERLMKYARMIASRYWILFRIEGNNEFITSDNPFTLGSINDSDDVPSHLDFLGPSNVIYYPISSKLMIAAYDRGVFLGAMEELNKQLVILDTTKESTFIDKVNRLMVRQCDRQAFAKSRTILKKACR